MKAIFPALLPILLIGGLIAIVLKTSALRPPGEIAVDDDLTDEIDLDLSDDPSPIHPTLPPDSEIPKAIIIHDDESNAASKPVANGPLHYASDDYPFVGQTFQLKKGNSWRAKFSVQLLSNGEVVQDFHSSPLTWRPNQVYSATLSDRSGNTFDAVFDTDYQQITLRSKVGSSVFTGKVDR
jgi:hypothetical protein